MKYQVRRYFSGYCTYEVEAENEEDAHKLTKNLPMDEDELIGTMEDWGECDQVEIVVE